MWTPSTITEWIDERICFIENILSSTKKITAENKRQISDCTLLLENFKYCKKSYLELLENSDNADTKKRFKNIAYKLILDTVHELDKQEYKCIYIHGFCFPTKEKDILPQGSIDNIAKIRVALKNIFYQVQQLGDGNFKNDYCFTLW